MPTSTRIVRRLCLLCAAAPFPICAQIATSPPAAATAETEETIVLSPFEVTTEGDSRYAATQTLAGTRIRTNLSDVGSAISVITEEFLKDTGVRNSEDLLVYTTNTEVGGVGGNFAGAGNGQRPDDTALLLRPNTNNRVRGLGSAENTRDFFRTDIPWDSYIVDRVDLQRGPNSILFGIGSPSGVINATVRGAAFKNSATVDARFGSYGSYRGSVGANQVLVKDQLAFRFDALYDKTSFQQEPAFSRDQRLYGALRFEPAFLKRNGASTSFKVSYEHGDIDANRPRTLPPVDRISTWFTELNRRTYDVVDAWNPRASVPGSGAVSSGNANFQPRIGQIYGGNFAYFGDPASSAQSGPFFSPEDSRTFRFGLGANGAIDGSINGLPFYRQLAIADYASYAQAARLPFAGDYKNQSITNPALFNFYDRLIDGPNKSERRSFDAVNAVLSQTFANNRFGVELAYDQQEYQDTQDALFAGSNVTVTVDINDQLPDGTANPNVGRPMIVSRSNSGSSGRVTHRETSRLTAFGEFRAADFLDRESKLAKIIGRHVVTGLYSDEQYDREDLQFARYALDASYGTLTNGGNGFDPARELQVLSYLGGDLRGASSAAGLNLNNIRAVQRPTATQLRYFDSRWKAPVNPATTGYIDPSATWVNPFNGSTLTQSENPANYGGWTNAPMTVLDSANGDRRQLTREARLNRDAVESTALVWQGFLFDGTVVGTYGWRRDDAEAFTHLAPPTSSGYVETQNGYVLPATPFSSVSGDTTSWSIVLHTPAFLREHMPFGSRVSLFYNRSDNFEPAAGRVDMLGVPYAPPTGTTEDYGFNLSALNNKVSLKVTWYETVAANASTNLTNSYFLGSVESRAWVAAKKFQAGLTGNPAYAGASFNYGAVVNGVFTQTAADRQLQQAHVDAVLTAFEPSIWAAWNMSPTDTKWQLTAWDPWSASLGGAAPGGLTATADTLSKGQEYELQVRPISNLDIVINASKTTATRTNYAGGTLGKWVDQRNAVWSGTAGDIRMWSGTGTGSMKQQWNDTFYNNFTLQRLLEGSAVSELRPWRFNAVANYGFNEGRLKGMNVGGSYRWEDRSVIGYPSTTIPNPSGTGTLNSYNISEPFYGPREDSVDFWVGYRMRLMDRTNWRIQVNVRNAFGKNELIPLNAQPDGSAAAFRIKEGPTWWVTNTFSF